MKKIIFGFGAASLVLSFAALASDPSGSTGVDPVQHAIRSGIMSGQSGTRLATNANPSSSQDPVQHAVRAGLMSGQTGSEIPTNQRFRVAGPSDPVNTVIRAGYMEARPGDYAAAGNGARAENTQAMKQAEKN